MTPTFEDQPRLNPQAKDGHIETDAGGRACILFERHLAHPVERVWRAITDPAAGFWQPGQMTIDPRLGGAIAIDFGECDGASPEPSSGEISAWDPPRLLEYWFDIRDSAIRYRRHRCRWELREAEDGCVLAFVTTLSPGEPAQLVIVTGWHVVLDMLAMALAGEPSLTSETQSELERALEERYPNVV